MKLEERIVRSSETHWDYAERIEHSAIERWLEKLTVRCSATGTSNPITQQMTVFQQPGRTSIRDRLAASPLLLSSFPFEES